MSCEPMLMQLLEAEPDELRRVVDTPLSRHLAGCARCAAVADRLIVDTAQLAFAVHANAAIAVRPARRLARLWVVPGVAAAAVAVLLWRGDTPQAERGATAVVVTPSPVVTTPVVVAEAPRPAAVEAPRAAPRVAPAGRRLQVRPEPQLVAYRVEPVVVAPIPAPVPVSVSPTALDPLGGSEASRDQPAARGTVLHSTVPGVTVIWSNK
jgi:hypothetical protein